MRNFLTAALFVGASTLCTPAWAQNSPVWSEVENWVIAIDTSLQNSCFTVTSFDDGTVLRIGFDATAENTPYYIMIGNDRWKSLEEGKDYDLTVQLDEESSWNSPARGVTMSESGIVYLMMGGEDFTFIEDFTRKHWMKITYEGRVIANLSLAHSYKATTAMAECQVAAGAAAEDPFSEPPKKVKDDPFAI